MEVEVGGFGLRAHNMFVKQEQEKETGVVARVTLQARFRRRISS
jgi:hypothetical protein